ncbi:MAG: DUF72 domain-containing protein [Chitinophagales bacterium]
MALEKYYLGGPIWANKDWQGTLFTRKAKAKDFLKQYAQIFNTVEGSGTFYVLPSLKMLTKWNEDTPSHFRFTFKFSREITHLRHLRNVAGETYQFFKTMQPISHKVGSFFLQLPPSFNAHYLPNLARFLPTLSKDFNYAVEVRHLDFFRNKDNQNRLNDLLIKHNMDRAIFDTTVLHNIQNSDNQEIIIAQGKKPKMPRHLIATAQQPFLRYVGYQKAEENRIALQPIVKEIAAYIANDKKPYVFMHTAGDRFAPELCRLFHELLQAELPTIQLGKMPAFLGEKERKTGQINLF